MFILSGETLSRKCSLFKGSLNCTPQASRASLVPFPCDSMLWQVKAILELKPNPAWRLRYRGACKQKNIKKIMRLLGDSFSQNHPHSTTVNNIMRFLNFTGWKPRWKNRSGIVTYHHSHWPIVQVDNVGSLAELRQEFQCCTWEVGEAIEIVRLVVNALAAKKVLGVKRINEIHKKALHNATPHCVLVHSSVKVRVELPAQHLHNIYI